jgi:hypothetical protein
MTAEKGGGMDDLSEEDRTELAELHAAREEKHQAGVAALRQELAGQVAGPVAGSLRPGEQAGSLATLYCEDNGGLGIYLDHDRARYVIRMPVDSGVEPGVVDLGGTEAIVERSRYGKAEIDTILDTLSLRRWHPEARNYVYVFTYNAKTDRVDADSSAPPGVIAPLVERFPAGLEVRFSPMKSRGAPR